MKNSDFFLEYTAEDLMSEFSMLNQCRNGLYVMGSNLLLALSFGSIVDRVKKQILKDKQFRNKVSGIKKILSKS